MTIPITIKENLLAWNKEISEPTDPIETYDIPQCDENSLMDCARQGTYRMVYSVVHDLGFHLWGPYW